MDTNLQKIAVLEAELARLQLELAEEKARSKTLAERLKASNEQVVELWRSGPSKRGVRKRAVRTSRVPRW